MPSLASLPSLGAWWQASRPLAQANLALPLLLGQALAVGAGARFDPWLALLVHAFGLALHLFIVFSNDYADRDIDVAGTRTLVSGGSGVLVEGKLRPRALARAAGAMAAAMLGCTLLLALGFDRPGAPLAWGAALLLVWAYGSPPLGLSRRGGGELLQGLGVGVVLPLFGFHAQAGAGIPLPASILGATWLMACSGNVATALPDFEVDRLASKRTLVVRLGPRRSAALALAALPLAAWMVPASIGGGPSLAAAALVAILPGLLLARSAETRALAIALLHGGVMSGLLLALTLASLLGG